jgi:hypothetical protein
LKLELKIHNLPSYAKVFIFAFLLTLSLGYYTGVLFVKHTTEFTPQGIEESYNGNQIEEEMTEDDWENDDWKVENSNPLKYKKSEQEIISIVHAHVISFSLIFLLLGVIVMLTSIPLWLKKILIIEPFISIVLTFGGIWMLWKDIAWMKYIVMCSGILLTITFSLSVLIVIQQLLKKPTV